MNTPQLLPIPLASPETNFLGPPAVPTSGARSGYIAGETPNINPNPSLFQISFQAPSQIVQIALVVFQHSTCLAWYTHAPRSQKKVSLGTCTHRDVMIRSQTKMCASKKT